MRAAAAVLALVAPLPVVRAQPPSPLVPQTGPGITDYTAGDGSQSWWDTDLCVPLSALGNVWVMGGDVFDGGDASKSAALSASSIGLVGPVGSAPAWQVTPAGLPLPVYPRIAASTVPAGAIALPGSPNSNGADGTPAVLVLGL